ncbi:MAG: hypothetical protein JO332_10245 [Planctomycetaceae bacterium]|nr:hypothetical protein [Planctomycetaceae bacterium]
MDAPNVVPADWIRGWIGMLDARQPGWRRDYDSEAFELAVADLFGDEARPEFRPQDLDILGEFTVDGPEQAAALGRHELASSDEFRRAMSDFEYQFRLCHGSSRASSHLREARAGALGRVIDVLLRPLLKRLDAVGHAMDMRDRRAAKRFAVLPETPTGDDRAVPPLLEAMGREAAERVADRARKELSPPALAAVRTVFLDPDGGPARDVAAKEGISAATVSRALQRLRELSAEELRGCPEEVHRAFATTLFQSLGAA